jgi:glycosyltransferase involved in cell wall biosynthesis
MSRSKGWSVLFEAAKQVCLTKRNVAFGFYGAPLSEADRREIDNAFQSLRSDCPLTYYGQVDAETRDRVLCSADILCLPSCHCHEAQPFAILEAMAAGCAILASRVGALPELVDEPNGGLLVEPDDVKGLADALVSLIEHPERRRQMGAHNRERITQEYAKEQMVAQWIALVERLTTNARPRRE